MVLAHSLRVDVSVPRRLFTALLETAIVSATKTAGVVEFDCFFPGNGTPVAVDSPAWFAELEQWDVRRFIFASPDGLPQTYLADFHKWGWGWRARWYAQRTGKMPPGTILGGMRRRARTIWVGPSSAMTLARMWAAAEALVAREQRETGILTAQHPELSD